MEQQQAALEKLSGRIGREVAEAQAVHRQYEEELEAARSELRVAKDVTIPALVAANKMLQERWDAETAIQVRRQVAALPGERHEI
ncbi:MAG: hypothetical protein Q9M27_03010 [Mariprofundaceae bacterium]|nr:hypothetical protein [Mariprofundaceae bacterium]